MTTNPCQTPHPSQPLLPTQRKSPTVAELTRAVEESGIYEGDYINVKLNYTPYVSLLTTHENNFLVPQAHSIAGFHDRLLFQGCLGDRRSAFYSDGKTDAGFGTEYNIGGVYEEVSS